MKILFISTSSGSHGGGELYLIKLGKGLAQAGHTVALACAHHSKMDALCAAFSQFGKTFRFPYQNTYDSPLKSLKYALPQRGVFAGLESTLKNWKPDIVHLNKQNLEDGLDLLKWIEQQPIPALQTIHVLRSPRDLGARFGALRDAVTCKALKAHTLPTLLIASEPERIYFQQKRLIPEALTRHIANGVEAIPEAQQPTPDQPLRILSLSRLHAQKRPLLWLEWAQALSTQLPDTRFDWCGDGMMETEFLEKAGQLNLQNLHYHGWVNDTAARISQAHYLMHSAAYEGQPFALLEALSAGLPIITDSALVETQPELAPAMIRFHDIKQAPEKLRDPLFYRELRSAALRLYKDFFSIDVMVGNTLQFYHDILNRALP